VVSGAASAVVEDDPHAVTNKDALRMMATATTANRELFRLMTTHSSGNRGSRDTLCRALARYERGGHTGLEAGDGGVEDVARERVVVFAGGEAMADADDRRTDERCPQHVHRGIRAQRLRERAGVDRLLDRGDRVVEHLLQELEAFPLLRDARHGLIDEHQQKVGGMLLRELVEGPPVA